MNPPAQPSPRDLFLEALEHPASQRAAFLDTACQGDAALRAAVEELLANHREDTFLEDAAVALPTVLALPSEQPGERIGRYKLLQQIGEGGFGTVWMAEQVEPVSRRVALKIIKLGMDTREVIARFEAERQALAMMEHPNIARVFDAGATDKGRPYFVMELVKGVTITHYCDEAGLSTRERLALFGDVCSAISHAHQKGIIHRDIKPSNVMVTLHGDRPVVKVIDFGIAKATQGRLTDKTLFTRFEQFIGTPVYMSPEQASVSGLDVDTRSDIYALGILLYELLTGKPPFDSKTLASAGYEEMRRIIREVEPPRPSTVIRKLTTASAPGGSPAKSQILNLKSRIPPDLDWIVMKCLEKDRARRYDTANGLALDLQRHLTNEAVTARPPTAAYVFGKLIRRHRLAFAAGTAIAASLVIGIAVSVWQAVRATRAEHETAAAFDELRASAPAFAEQARALAAKEQYADAIVKLDYAIKLRPDAAEFLVAKADLLQCQLQLAPAAAIFREALRVQSGHARAEASAKLCEELLAAPPAADGKLSRESLAKLHIAMQQQQRPAAELLPVARLLGEENKHLLAAWLERLKDLPVSAERPLAQRLTVREDGRLALDLFGTKITSLTPLAGAPLAVLNVDGSRDLTDLSPLAGIPLLVLNITNTRVADLTPLREMYSLEELHANGTPVSDLSPLSALRLRELHLHFAPVTDLSPLRQMPLEELNLSETRVTDLSPLAGLPIKVLHLLSSPVRDFSPLARMPLETGYFDGCHITDLAFLRDCPLKKLELRGCNQSRNFAALAQIPTLETLLLPDTFRTLPDEDFAAIGALRTHPRLHQIQGDYAYAMFYTAPQSKELFWQDWDRLQTFLPALRKTGFPFKLNRLADGTYTLEMRGQPLSDLPILKGAPISRLVLAGCQITDLTPLAGTPLTFLDLSQNPLTDLTPLAGLPLKALFLKDCRNVTDIAPLTGIPTLKNLIVPATALNFEPLRTMPGLERLSFKEESNNPHRTAQTAAEFWKEWDARKK